MSITTAKNVGVWLASAATDVATFLTQHVEEPPLSGVSIEYDHVAGQPLARCQLGPTPTALASLATWMDDLDDVSVTARRFVSYDPPFTSVAVHTVAGGTALQVWTHPDDDELAALWHAVGHEPEPATTAPITVDALRVAVEAVQVARESDQDTTSEPDADAEVAS